MKHALAFPVMLTGLLCLPLSLTASLSIAAADSAPFATPKKPELVDLNSATRAELVKLPGLGEALASKIIAGRPWRSKYDLVVKKVVTRGVYDKFSRLVIARQ